MVFNATFSNVSVISWQSVSFICCRQASSFAGSSILRSDVDEDVDEEVVETDNV
jgi:hypothetical protein